MVGRIVVSGDVAETNPNDTTMSVRHVLAKFRPRTTLKTSVTAFLSAIPLCRLVSRLHHAEGRLSFEINQNNSVRRLWYGLFAYLYGEKSLNGTALPNEKLADRL